MSSFARKIIPYAVLAFATSLLACAQFNSEPGYLGLMLSGDGAGAASAADDGSSSGGGSGGGTSGTTTAVAVQTGTTTIAGAGAANTYTQDVTITSVDTTSSFLIFQARHNSNVPPDSLVRGELLNATTVRFTKVTNAAGTMTIRWYVVTYPSGTISVQRGNLSQATLPANVTITDVGTTAQAFVLWSKTPEATASEWGQDDPLTLKLTSTTNLQMDSNTTAASGVVAYQVVSFIDASLIDVQTGSTSMAVGVTTANATIASAIDTSKTFLLNDYITDGTGADVGARMINGRFSSTTGVTFDRGNGGDTDDLTDVAYQAVQLNDGTSVQSGTATFVAAETTKNIAISTIDTGATAALLSTQCGAGQGCGATPYTTDDIVGESSFTTDLTATQLTLTRDSANDAATVDWFVVQFGK